MTRDHLSVRQVPEEPASKQRGQLSLRDSKLFSRRLPVQPNDAFLSGFPSGRFWVRPALLLPHCCRSPKTSMQRFCGLCFFPGL